MDYRLTLILTTACNLACDYCYQRERSPTVMSAETAAAAIDWSLAQVGEGDALQLHFFGGEPLLAWDRLVETHRYADVRCALRGRLLRAFVVTNGTLLDPARVEWLRANEVHLTVSLDGMVESHDVHRRFPDGRGSFATVWQALETLPDRSAVEFNLVISPRNVEHLARSVTSLLGHGFRRMAFCPDYSSAWDDPRDRSLLHAAFAELARVYIAALQREEPVFFSFVEEKIRRLMAPEAGCGGLCNLGKGEVAVGPTGHVFACERVIDAGPASPLYLGELAALTAAGDDLRHAAESALAERVSDLRDRRGRRDRCRDCRDVGACSGFCACANIARTGDVGRPDDAICLFERLFIETSRVVAAAILPGANGVE